MALVPSWRMYDQLESSEEMINSTKPAVGTAHWGGDRGCFIPLGKVTVTLLEPLEWRDVTSDFSFTTKQCYLTASLTKRKRFAISPFHLPLPWLTPSLPGKYNIKSQQLFQESKGKNDQRTILAKATAPATKTAVTREEGHVSNNGSWHGVQRHFCRLAWFWLLPFRGAGDGGRARRPPELVSSLLISRECEEGGWRLNYVTVKYDRAPSLLFSAWSCKRHKPVVSSLGSLVAAGI